MRYFLIPFLGSPLAGIGHLDAAESVEITTERFTLSDDARAAIGNLAPDQITDDLLADDVSPWATNCFAKVELNLREWTLMPQLIFSEQIFRFSVKENRLSILKSVNFYISFRLP